MRAGALNVPLWIQSPVETLQADGSKKVTSYSNVVKWWAQKLTTSGQESLAAHQLYGTRAVVFRGRFIPSTAVTSKMVLYDGSKRFDIKVSLDPDGRRRELLVTATERDV